MHVYRWMSINNRPVLLKWLFYRTETINTCAWLRMARMEKMGSNLKTSGRFFHVLHALVSQIKPIKTDFG